MSETPNDESGNGGQPQDGQGGQPQGGQPQGGQPQSGQPQGGQPQGQPHAQPQGGQPHAQPQGQPAQGAPVNTGPGIGDIFNRPDTKSSIKTGVAGFAMVGVGIGLAILLNGALADSSDPGYFIAVLMFLASFAVPPVVSTIVALEQSKNLTDPPQNLRYATAGVTGAAGGFVLVLLTSILGAIGLDTGSSGSFLSAPEIGDIILPAILIAIGAGVTAAGIVWALDNL